MRTLPVLADPPRAAMHFRRLMFLRGPNIWSRNPVMEVWVDLGELKERSSELIPGFTDRLMAAMPTLIEHRCSVGERGGFLQRLHRGTYMAHVLEHVALELQSLAGTVVGFGRARETSTDGLYKVAIRYQEEHTAYECLLAAREIVLACVDDRPLDMPAVLERLKDVADAKCLGPSSQAILNAATARNIPFVRLNNGSLVQLGQGRQQRRIWTAETDRTGAIAETIAQDKQMTKSLLRAVGVPVPEGRLVEDAEDAWAAAEEVGLPVVVKPRDANHARGVYHNLKTRDEIVDAYAKALEEGSGVIVERFIPGCEHRVLVVGNKVVAAVRGDPVFVTGDGRRTIQQLVEEDVNTDPRRGWEEDCPLCYVRLTFANLLELKQQGYTPDSIPPEGAKIIVTRSDNLSRDVTDEIHPSVAHHAVLAVRTVGLDVAGLDMVLEDISRPLEDQGGAVVEVNAGPGLLMHLKPLVGKPRPVGEAIIDQMIPPGEDARIPIVCVTGSNGKTTVARLVRHLLRVAGTTVGLADSLGCEAGNWRLDDGPCDDAPHARRLLLHPEIDAAVFETGADGILREGLGCDKCDVAVVTNLADPDHLAGEFDIYDADKMFAVKRTPVDVVLPHGAAVLNAEDPQTLAMQGLSKGDVVLFARDGLLPAIVEHLQAGKRAVIAQHGQLLLYHGAKHQELMPLSHVSLLAHGHPAFQVENVLAATAAGWALGLSREILRRGLETFAPATELPRHDQAATEQGAWIITDQPNNGAALAAVIEGLQRWQHARRRAVYTVVGDRRDEDIVRQGRQLAEAFDEVFIYERAHTHGRPTGQVTQLLQQGIAEGKRAQRVVVCSGWEDAVAQAKQEIAAGDLVLVQKLSE